MHSKLFALASLLFYSSAFAAIWESDGTPANVQSIHDTKAADGDTITIPSGTFTWRSRVTITKGVTLKGQGIGATIVKDAMASGTLVSITTKANKFTRLTGIEFQDGAEPRLR